MTYAEFVPRWRETFEERHTAGTVRSYEGSLRNHLLPAFGHLRLRDVRLSTVQEWVDRGSARRLDPKTIRRVLAAHRSVMNAAARLDLCEAPRIAGLDLPKMPEKQAPHALTYQELERLAAAAGEWWAPMVMFAGVTGLRRGELAGLDDDDVDVRSRVCHVKRQLDERGYLEAPKSRASRREVQLPAAACQAIATMRELKLEVGLRGGAAFPTPRGGRVMWRSWYDSVWAPTRRAAGLPEELTVHDLRHTAATLMIAAGVEAKFIQEQLGHEKLTTTLDTYSHWFRERSPAMVDRFDQAYGGG